MMGFNLNQITSSLAQRLEKVKKRRPDPRSGVKICIGGYPNRG